MARLTGTSVDEVHEYTIGSSGDFTTWSSFFAAIEDDPCGTLIGKQVTDITETNTASLSPYINWAYSQLILCSAEPHKGCFASGYITTFNLPATVCDGFHITFSESFCTIVGLNIKLSTSNAGDGAAIAINRGYRVYVKDCLINCGNTTYNGIYAEGEYGSSIFGTNLVIVSGQYGILDVIGSSIGVNAHVWQNCTLYKNDIGFWNYKASSGNIVLQNIASFENNEYDYAYYNVKYGGLYGNHSGCASSDNTGDRNLRYLKEAEQFASVTYDSPNFLKAGSGSILAVSGLIGMPSVWGYSNFGHGLESTDWIDTEDWDNYPILVKWSYGLSFFGGQGAWNYNYNYISAPWPYLGYVLYWPPTAGYFYWDFQTESLAYLKYGIRGNFRPWSGPSGTIASIGADEYDPDHPSLPYGTDPSRTTTWGTYHIGDGGDFPTWSACFNSITLTPDSHWFDLYQISDIIESGTARIPDTIVWGAGEVPAGLAMHGSGYTTTFLLNNGQNGFEFNMTPKTLSDPARLLPAPVWMNGLYIKLDKGSEGSGFLIKAYSYPNNVTKIGWQVKILNTHPLDYFADGYYDASYDFFGNCFHASGLIIDCSGGPTANFHPVWKMYSGSLYTDWWTEYDTADYHGWGNGSIGIDEFSNPAVRCITVLNESGAYQPPPFNPPDLYIVPTYETIPSGNIREQVDFLASGLPDITNREGQMALDSVSGRLYIANENEWSEIPYGGDRLVTAYHNAHALALTLQPGNFYRDPSGYLRVVY